MARSSKIKHPPGDIFFMAYAWSVKVVGKNAAFLLGYLDFLDQRNSRPSLLLASRAEIIAGVQGIVGRDGVDKALDLLVDLGWVNKKECREVSQNIRTWYEYSLAPDKINVYLDGDHQEGRLPEIRTEIRTGIRIPSKQRFIFRRRSPFCCCFLSE